MNENGFYIPPCCADVKLPRAILQAPNRALSFYTMGDVSVEKFYKSIAYLVKGPQVMVLSMPSMTFATASYLAHCFERGWISDLILFTNKDVSDLLKNYLEPHASHVLYVQARNVTELSSHLVLYNDQQALTICGPMIESSVSGYSLVNYQLQYVTDLSVFTSQPFAHPLRNVLIPDLFRVRGKKYDYSLSERILDFIHTDIPDYK